MKILYSLRSKIGIFSELVSFLWKRKIWWLIPLVILLMLLIAVLAIESASGLAPFIYTFI
jgi:hypothetical protein